MLWKCCQAPLLSLLVYPSAMLELDFCISITLTLARTWGMSTPPPQLGFVPCTPVFLSWRSDFCYSCFLNIFVRFTENFKGLQPLVREIWPCSRGHVTAQMPIYLILRWFRVWYRIDVLCKLHLPYIKKWDQTLYQGQIQGQGQLRSIIMLHWLEVKFSTWPSEVKKYMFRCVLKRETRWCLNYSAAFLSSKVMCEKL